MCSPPLVPPSRIAWRSLSQTPCLPGRCHSACLPRLDDGAFGRDRDTARCPVRHALSAARISDDHLAGRLSVDLTDSFVAGEYVVLDYEAAEITKAGARLFTEFGIALPTLRSTRRHSCRLCLDWTERRPHIAGAVGAALTKRYFDLGWMERMKGGHAVIVTPLGRRGFQETFGIDGAVLR